MSSRVGIAERPSHATANSPPGLAAIAGLSWAEATVVLTTPPPATGPVAGPRENRTATVAHAVSARRSGKHIPCGLEVAARVEGDHRIVVEPRGNNRVSRKLVAQRSQRSAEAACDRVLGALVLPDGRELTVGEHRDLGVLLEAGCRLVQLDLAGEGGGGRSGAGHRDRDSRRRGRRPALQSSRYLIRRCSQTLSVTSTTGLTARSLARGASLLRDPGRRIGKTLNQGHRLVSAAAAVSTPERAHNRRRNLLPGGRNDADDSRPRPDRPGHGFRDRPGRRHRVLHREARLRAPRRRSVRQW